MTDTKTLVNILSTIGTILWSIQLVPQIIHNYRRKDCTGLPPQMLFLWAACGIPFSIYLCSSNSAIALQVQPQLFTSLCFVSWMQALYYPPVSMATKKIILIGCIFVAIGLAFEIGFIIPLKHLYVAKDITWPTLIFGVLASVLLVLGLIPPYFELAKRQGRVIGINFVFLSMDFGGALFSALSLAVSGEVDIMGVILYAIVGVLELGIFFSHIIWLLRSRVFKTISDEEEEEEEQDVTVDLEKSSDNNKDSCDDKDVDEDVDDLLDAMETQVDNTANNDSIPKQEDV